MRVIGLGVLCGLMLTASPAAAAADKTHLQLMAEIRMLQEQSQQLQALLGNLQDALKAVSAKIDDQSAAMRKAMADQTLATSNIGDNVRVLREKTDETNVRLSTVAQEIDALRQSLTTPPVAAPAGTIPPTGAEPGAPAPQTAAPPAPTPTGVSPQRMFDASFDDYSAGRWDLAIQGFRGFIQAFPRLPPAADAQYNIGMAFFNQSKWPEARDEFQKVIQEYPQATERVADAYYKLGQTFEQLKQIDNAKRAYETLVQRFPNAFTASQARQALDRLTKK
jgi:tol-pal system protein YbgF